MQYYTMSKIVYFDDEMNKIYNEVKKNNPNFNFSGFVKKIMKEYNMDEEDIDIDKVKHEVKNIELEIERLRERKRFMEERIVSFIAGRKDRSKKEKDEIKELADTIVKYCDVNPYQAKVLAKEYFPQQNKISITKFIEDKKISLLS